RYRARVLALVGGGAGHGRVADRRQVARGEAAGNGPRAVDHIGRRRRRVGQGRPGRIRSRERHVGGGAGGRRTGGIDDRHLEGARRREAAAVGRRAGDRRRPERVHGAGGRVTEHGRRGGVLGVRRGRVPADGGATGGVALDRQERRQVERRGRVGLRRP